MSADILARAMGTVMHHNTRYTVNVVVFFFFCDLMNECSVAKRWEDTANTDATG